MNRGKGRGPDIGDNVQTAGEATHKLLVAGAVTNEPGARDGRSPMALPAKDVRACRVDAVADVGDAHGHAVSACLEAGITPSGSRPLTSANGPLGLFSQDDVTYARATDTYPCPAGARLTCRVDPVALGRPIRDDATAACPGCALQPPCTRKKGGRRITRGVDAQLLEARAPRVRSRPAVRKRRQELGEPPVGTMPRGWDHGDFLMRGLAKVRTECSLTVRADNRRRVLTLIEMPQLLAALG